MPLIQQLDPHVADLIAAGEVVERPASVVKELVENAMDAGASAVVVEIQRGGMALIRVTDNGCGIAPGEMPTAFLRHATSKLREAGDLAAIGTLGFRGEALAAISAVSRLDVLSRQKGAQLGASLSLVGGTPGQVEDAGCPEGTTMMVRELFYNTPARLKFMKSDSAEAAAVGAMLGQIALSHPEVSIRYLRDGKEELHTPGDGKLLSAIYAVRGRDFALNLTEVEGGGEGVSVHGYVTDPLAGRGTRAMQAFFCCGRMIKSALLTAALEEAYANRQMKGKFPGCVLHIDLPLYEVDVNVHPAKTVVKFVHERAVFSAVHHTVKDTLDGGLKAAGTAVPMPAGRTKDVPTAGVREAMEASAPRPAGRANPPPPLAAPRSDFYQSMDAKTFREQGVPSGGQGNRLLLRDGARPVSSRERPAAPAAPSGGIGTFAVRITSPPPGAPEKPVQPPPEPPAQASLTGGTPVPWRLAGEIFHTYIVAEDGEDMWLIDKHAAHERINFDRMKANTEPIMRQQLLSCTAVDLPQEQYAALLEHLPLLEEFGFEAEDFGSGCLAIRAIPSDLETGQIRETLEMLADKLLTGAGADPAAARDAMLHTMACKASIKGGWKSDPAELRALIGRVQSGEVQFCPHGRPVKVKLSKYDIEKMFKRA